MTSDTFIDPLPLWAVLLGTILLGLLVGELGFRLGRFWQRSTHSNKEGSVGAMAAATLGMLAFLLAFVTSMAATRFDNRRALVVEEANAIGTTFLRAGFLNQPLRGEARTLLAEYVDIRLAAAQDSSLLSQTLARSEQIQIALWLQVEQMHSADMAASGVDLYIEALNGMIDTHTKRSVAVTSSRLPGELWLGIYGVAMLTMLLVGLQNSFGECRNWVSLVVLVTVFALVLTLIVDLDRPTQGLLTVSQQAMMDLQALIKGVMP
ncbi:MAG: hypothetical protein V9H69_13440 [Anaerolineae bacterium]